MSQTETAPLDLPAPGEATALDAPAADDGGFYTQDVEFRSGVVAFQVPLLMAVVAAARGFVPPSPIGAFRYCDLGCGDGTTVNALAAMNPEAEFIGIDFNPQHIAQARATAAECGLANARFVETSFVDLAQHDWPQFDFVGMNGIYSWLEEAPTAAVHRFLERHLQPGGLFYAEYTSLPGKSSVVALWRLIQTLVPPEGTDSRERARRGLALTEALARRGMAFLNTHRPAANGARSYITGRRRSDYQVDHFAHNALASGFRPRYFTEMYDEMAAIGLSFAGRCELKLNDLELAVPPAQVPTFQDFKDVRLTELLKDYIRNEQQRHDVFVAAATPDPAGAAAFLDTHVRLLARLPAGQVQRSITGAGNRKLPLRGPAFEAVIDGAAEAAVTPADLAGTANLPLDRLRRAALRLLASGQFVLCRTAAVPLPADPATIEAIAVPDAINRVLLARAADRLGPTQLVSPVAGGPAIPLSPLESLLLHIAGETGRFSGVSEAALPRLANESRPMPTLKGTKPGKALGAADLEETLRLMRGRKLVNMLRLGIVEPA
ncbi:MAG: methyltransferase domain-containing protein [Alphaproteobacteria bacterium]|nr:methyltransferase domain-containing protein [Alphaproteobacteria bacterium]